MPKPIIARPPYLKRPIPGTYDYTWFVVELGNIGRAIPSQRVRTVTADYRLQVDDFTVLVDATTGPISITLPKADQVQWGLWNIKRINGGGNAVTLIGEVDGITNPVLAGQYDGKTIQSDGSTFYVIGVF